MNNDAEKDHNKPLESSKDTTAIVRSHSPLREENVLDNDLDLKL